VTVSDRAFRVRVPMLMSFAQEGMSPQRIVEKLRDFLPSSLRTVKTRCVGAILYRGPSSSSSWESKRSARYCFECVNRYRLHIVSLSQMCKPQFTDHRMTSSVSFVCNALPGQTVRPIHPLLLSRLSASLR
jgi:hypothetical protein